MMFSAGLLLCIVSAPGLVDASLPEAGLKISLPTDPVLVASGVDPDSPQSVNRMVWESKSDGGQVRISFEQWKKPQFAPEKALELFARRRLGLDSGFTISESKIGGYSASRLDLNSQTLIRAKSGNDAWQIEFKGVDKLEISQIIASAKFAADQEIEGTYDPYGNLQDVGPSPRPTPDIGPSKVQKLPEAHISLASPIKLEMRQSEAPPTGITAISEWFGRRDNTDVFVSYFKLAENKTLDMSGWIAAYGDRLRTDGVLNFKPNISKFQVPGGDGRQIIGTGDLGGQKASIQVILVVKGSQCWSIQTRVTGTTASKIHESVKKSLTFLP